MNTDTDIITYFARVLIDTGAKHIYIVTSSDGISIIEFEDLQSKMLLLCPSIDLHRLRMPVSSHSTDGSLLR